MYLDTSLESSKKRSLDKALETEGLSVVYGNSEKEALQSVALELHHNDCCVIFGSSGSGKTTLFRALEGSVKPSSGKIKSSGRVSLVHQDLRLVAEKTVLFNVCCGALSQSSSFAAITGFEKATQDKAQDLIRELGLQELSLQKISCLSGGQKQRVAIARALMSDPSVVLADEPFAALDCANARRVLTLLREVQRKHEFALVISMHQSELVGDEFNRAFRMCEGLLKEVPVNDASALMCGGCDCIKEELQDRSLQKKPTILEDHGFSALGMALLLIALWSVYSLGILGAGSLDSLGNFAKLTSSFFPQSWAEFTQLPWKRLSLSLVETIQMAFTGTFIGIVISLPLAALASNTVTPFAIRSFTRLVLNLFRTIPAIFWGLIFVAAVGLGPVSGTLGLAAYSIGYLGKFFYEALESVDMKPTEALRSLGATRIQSFIAATVPVVRPLFISSGLFMLEYNIRSASILGIVGAGGIGQDLMYYFEWRKFPEAAAGLLLILSIVIVLDVISTYWRKKLVAEKGS